MFKKVILLVLGLVLLLSANVFAQNMFSNADFSNGVNGWSTVGYPFYAIVRAPNYAAENTITTVSDRDYFAEIYQVITPFTAGDPVYMTAEIKTQLDPGSSASGGIIVEFLNASNNVLNTITTSVVGNTNWNTVYVTGTAPAGTVKIRAGAFVFAAEDDSAALNGKVSVDNLFIDNIQAPGGGLITNPGFESQISGWTTGVGSYPFIASTAQTHSGVYSAYDAVNSVSGDYWGFIYQTPTVPVGGTIYASAWGKTEISPLSSAVGGLIVQFLNSSGVLISKLESKIGGNTDWHQLYVSGTVPVGTVTIKVGGYLWAANGDSAALGGKVYIDDFAVSTTPIPPPQQPQELINSDFENGVNDWAWIYRPFVASTTAHTGIYSAKHNIGNTTGPNDYLAEIYQEIPFTAGNVAYLTGWVKTNINPARTAVGGIKVQFVDAAGTLIGAASQADRDGINDWTLLYVNAVAPTGTAKVRISAFAWADNNQGTVNGDVFIDGLAFSNTPPSSLLLNSSFESDMAGWTQDATGYPMTAVTEEHRTGAKSAKTTIQLPGGSSDFWSRIYQEFTIVPGQALYATAWAKTAINPSSTGTAGLKIEFFNGTTPTGSVTSNTVGGQAGWTYLYAFATAPAGTTKARISPFVSCPRATANLGGNVYFDDVYGSFDQLPPPAFRTALINASFDDGSGLGGWTDLYGLPTTLDSINSYSIPYSAKKTFAQIPDQDYYTTVYQDIYYNANGTPFPTARNVYLAAYIKTAINPLANASGGIALEYFDESGEAYTIDTDQVSANNDWRQLYVSGTIPAGATKVRVLGFAFAPLGETLADNGIVNFDNFNFSYNYIPEQVQTSLLNVGFENGLNDWDQLNRLAGITQAPVHGGNYSSYFDIQVDLVDPQDYYGTLSQDIAVLPGKIVEASAWVSTDIYPLTNAQAGIKLQFIDGNGQAIGPEYTNGIGGNTGWTQLSLVRTAPAQTAKVRYILFLYAEGLSAINGDRAYYDDASLLIRNAPGPGCFLAETPITLSDGSTKPIEEIKIGDMVMAYNEETKTLETNEVTTIFNHDKEDVYLLVNGTLKVTPVHRVLTKGEWKEIGTLAVGDTLTDMKGNDVLIASIEKVNEKVDIYNFEVSPLHTYIAGGFIVHNRKLNYTIAFGDGNGTR